MGGSLEGKTALVTGGSRGTGRVIAKRLAASGALVAFNYATSTELARDVVAEIEADGGQAFSIQAELGPEGSIEHLVETLAAEFERRKGSTGLDVLVNNIGGNQAEVRIGDYTPEYFDETFLINVRVPFLLTQALMSRLCEGGRVVNISSAAARAGRDDLAVYGMAKSALDTFSRLAAKTLGPRGITVNSVAVGRIAGKTNADVFADPEMVKFYAETTALRRIGTEDDIAGIVHALVSPDGGWITGQVIDGTGGFKM